MSDNMFIKDVTDDLRELIKYFREQFAEENKGLSWGMRGLPDDLFINWFETKAIENPNWVLALPYVENGMKEIARYERLMGLGGDE